MVPSTVCVFVTLLVICHSSTIPEQPKADLSSAIPEAIPSSSTPEPAKTTRGPHTHDEHPANDPDHSDHEHLEEKKAPLPVEDEDHEHPGHDHSESGHDHSLDHQDEKVEELKEEKPSSNEELKKAEEQPKPEEKILKRERRGLWKRRLD